MQTSPITRPMRPALLVGLLLQALVVLIAPGCGGDVKPGSGPPTLESPPASSPQGYESSSERGELSTQSVGAVATEGGSSPESTLDVPSPAMRIYRATLRLQVDDPVEAAARVRQLAQQHGAWLQAEREERQSWEHYVYLELRVPPARLDSLLRQCIELARFVAQKEISSEDVGQSYADLTARLNQKREALAQYQQLLKRATNVQDILAVQEGLRRLQEEIESTEAQRLYLSRQAAYSTVMLTLYRPLEGQREPRPGFWSRLGTAFGDGWQALQDFIVGIISAWGVLVPLGIGIWLFIRWRQRVRRRRAQQSASSEG